MKTSAIICEFNPFHNGHKYLVDKTKENGADAIVAIMSGNFTQRGDVAIFSKYNRARQALINGVDLVVEMPAVYAVSSAEFFAKAGVEIANGLGCVNELSFGSESGNIDEILTAVNAVKDIRIIENAKVLMQSGEYFPKAIEKSVLKYYGEDISSIFSKPNNILGIEYCKALANTLIEPKTVKRIAVDHHSTQAVNQFASATHIRSLLKSGDEITSKYIPNNYDENLLKDVHSIDNLEKAILYCLRTISINELTTLPDVGQGLENRIFDCIKNYNSVAEIIDNIKTKRYTHARLRRIIICALLGITADLQKAPVPYIRVLGFNKKGTQILSQAKTTAKLPIITKVSQSYDKLDCIDKRILDIDILASDVFALAEKNIGRCGEDYYTEIIKI